MFLLVLAKKKASIFITFSTFPETSDEGFRLEVNHLDSQTLSLRISNS